MAEGDDRAGDGGIVGAAGDVADEAAVDLELVNRQLLEVAERRIAGAEVVDGQADALLLEQAEGLDGTLGVLHDKGLGDLQFEIIRAESADLQRTLDRGHQLAAIDLGTGQVDRQSLQGQALVEPVGDLGASSFQHPLADFANQAATLGGIQEQPRGDKAANRVLPAHQRLGTSDVSTGGGHDRLVVNHELAALQGVAQLGLE